MYKKIIAGLAVVGLAVGLSTGLASAHVVVKPAEVGVASFQTFNTGVPNEDDQPVTKVRLVIPDGLNYVQPNVKPGWTIETIKEGEGEDAKVKEITWSGGSIPAGQRDDFAFSAQAPAKPTTVQWKAYQTYQDGTEVAWDQKPSGKDEEGSKPYSETKVVDDLSADSATVNSGEASQPADNNRANTAIALSVVALLVAVIAYSAVKSRK